MVQRYEVRSISQSRLAEAYPLMRAAQRDLQLEEWLRYASGLVGRTTPPLSGPRGIIGIEGNSGYLHGLLVFRVEIELRLGRTLKCEHVVVASLIGEHEVARCLLDAIDQIARVNDCAAVQVAVGEPGGSLTHALEQAGLSRDLAVFRKPLPQIRAAEDPR